MPYAARQPTSLMDTSYMLVCVCLCVCVCVSVCVTCIVTKHVLRNVALNKPSYQVSTYRDEYGLHSAGLANDGNRQTNYETTLNGCAHSQRETNPWWAVDLQVQTVVARVDLTNRGDTYGAHFTIVCLQ